MQIWAFWFIYFFFLTKSPKQGIFARKYFPLCRISDLSFLFFNGILGAMLLRPSSSDSSFCSLHLTKLLKKNNVMGLKYPYMRMRLKENIYTQLGLSIKIVDTELVALWHPSFHEWDLIIKLLHSDLWLVIPREMSIKWNLHLMILNLIIKVNLLHINLTTGHHLSMLHFF